MNEQVEKRAASILEPEYSKLSQDLKRDILVYVSDRHRAPNTHGVFNNIMSARSVAADVWEKGYTAICPHLNTLLMDGLIPDAAFLYADLQILKRCDVICMGPNWRQSEGAKMEHDLALRLGIPRVYHPNDLEALFRHD